MADCFASGAKPPYRQYELHGIRKPALIFKWLLTRSKLGHDRSHYFLPLFGANRTWR